MIHAKCRLHGLCKSQSGPSKFNWLQQNGNVAEHEMYRVFNCGIGMVVVIAKEDVERTLAILRASGEMVWQIGEIRKRAENEAQTMIV